MLKARLCKAVELYTKAAADGNAIAQTNLAHYYKIGRVVRLDINKAFELYSEAAAQDNPSALFNVGYFLFYWSRS